MSGWTSGEPDTEDVADAAGEPDAAAAATDGVATTGAGGATKGKAEPSAAAAGAPALTRAECSPDEEEPEVATPPDGPTLPCPAIHMPGPDDATLPPRGNYREYNKTKCRDR